MGASLSANALNQTLARVCEVPETGLAESQPLVPLSSTMTSNPASRPMIIPNTTGLMSFKENLIAEIVTATGFPFSVVDFQAKVNAGY